MEDKLLDEFQSFCKFNCKHRNKEIINEEVKIKHEGHCDDCDGDVNIYHTTYTEVLPCDYCRIQEFIREVSDRL